MPYLVRKLQASWSRGCLKESKTGLAAYMFVLLCGTGEEQGNSWRDRVIDSLLELMLFVSLFSCPCFFFNLSCLPSFCLFCFWVLRGFLLLCEIFFHASPVYSTHIQESEMKKMDGTLLSFFFFSSLSQEDNNATQNAVWLASIKSREAIQQLVCSSFNFWKCSKTLALSHSSSL